MTSATSVPTAAPSRAAAGPTSGDTAAAASASAADADAAGATVAGVLGGLFALLLVIVAVAVAVAIAIVIVLKKRKEAALDQEKLDTAAELEMGGPFGDAAGVSRVNPLPNKNASFGGGGDDAELCKPDGVNPMQRNAPMPIAVGDLGFAEAEPAIGVNPMQRNAPMPIAAGDLGFAGDAAATEERDLAVAEKRADTAQSFLSAMKGFGEDEDAISADQPSAYADGSGGGANSMQREVVGDHEEAVDLSGGHDEDKSIVVGGTEEHEAIDLDAIDSDEALLGELGGSEEHEAVDLSVADSDEALDLGIETDDEGSIQF